MGPMRFVWLFVILISLSSMAIGGVPADLPRLCYTSKDQLAPSYVLPCFRGLTDDQDVYGCCIAGDYCLANQACFNVPRGIAYQKGCTRKQYDDINCPLKCGTNQTKSDWVSLIYCNGTNETPQDTWVCNSPENCLHATNCPGDWDPQLEVTRTTYCEEIKHDGQWVAFKDKYPIKSTASLPQPSAVADWWSVHSNFSTRWHKTTTSPPPVTDPYAPTGLRYSSLETTDASASETSPRSTSDNSTMGLHKKMALSKDQKIGMAVGLGAGIPMLLAGTVFFIYYLQRRRSHGVDGKQSNCGLGTDQDNGAMEDGAMKDPTTEAYGYSTKAELPANERPTSIPEMDGNGTREKHNVRDHRNSNINDAPVYELSG